MSQTAAFDSLEYVQDLEAAGVPRKQAEAQAKALRKIVDERLVTRDYLDLKMREVDVRFGELEAKMRELEYSLIIKLRSMIIGSVAVIAALLKIMR